MTTTPRKCIGVRDAILDIFDDIDKATVTINSNCAVLSPETYSPDVFVMENAADGPSGSTINVGSARDSHIERALFNLRKMKFSFEIYHPPCILVYNYQDTAYLGIILLWTDLKRAPVSRQTIAMMNDLEPIWLSIFASAAMYHQLRNPIDQVFGRSITRLFEQFELTEQERRIIVLRLLGHSSKEIADKTDLTIDTIKYHLKAVYRKTNTRNHAELFARFFTPKGDGDSLDD